MVSKVRVYAKAQNRTALGIAHAYMSMYPKTTLDDLRKAFPNELNPDRGVKENFIYAEEKGTTANWDGYFKADEELLTMGDGRKVSVVKMWTKPSLERIVNLAYTYYIEAIQIDLVNIEDKARGFRLEYINGYCPRKATNKKSLWWVWLVIVVLLVGAALVLL